MHDGRGTTLFALSEKNSCGNLDDKYRLSLKQEDSISATRQSLGI